MIPRQHLPPIMRMAIRQGSVEAVEGQLRGGVSPDARDTRGRTILMIAAEAGHAEICNVLLTAGADPTLLDCEGRDASTIASASGFAKLAARLAATPDQSQSRDTCKPAHLVDKIFNEVEPLDGSHWEAEPEPGPPPEQDLATTEAATAKQHRLSAHTPLDLDEDWSGVEIDLPDLIDLYGLSASRRNHDEGPVRELLLLGLRLGWVQPTWISEVTPVSEGTFNHNDSQYASNIATTLGDLRVSLDEEPLDQSSVASALTEVVGATELEEDLASEALYFLRCLNSWRVNPLSYWLRETSRFAIPSRDEETALGTICRDRGREGLTAILLSPAALDELLRVPEMITTGALQLSDALETEDESNTEDEFDGDEPDVYSVSNGAQTTANIDKLKYALSEIASLRHQLTTSVNPSGILDRMQQVLEKLPLSAPLIDRLQKIVRADTSAPEAKKQLELVFLQATEARNALVLGHLRLVAWIAKRYAWWSYSDAIQEGCIGLIKAVERFDPQKGAKLSTYANWWVRQSITRAIADTSRTVRTPVHMGERLRKIQRAQTSFANQTGRLPDLLELAKLTDLSSHEVQSALQVPEEPLSFSDSEVEINNIADSAAFDPEQSAVLKNLQNTVLAAINELSPRQKQILCMRFGLDGFEEHTLEEVGILFGVTRERIRQIEFKALQKLKHPARSMALKSFIE